MGHLRIRCAWPEQPAHDPRQRYPLVHGRLPDLSDCTFVMVADDGSEHEFKCVHSCTIKIDPGGVVTATLEIIGVEADIAAVRAPKE